MSVGTRIRLVGGVFAADAARPSGYFRQLAKALVGKLSDRAEVLVSNGGSMADLDALLEAEQSRPSNAVLWMADVPNTEAKRLPILAAIWHAHGTLLVQSKNNDGGRYSDRELTGRMHDSGAEALLELYRTDAGVAGRIHLITGECGEPTTRIGDTAASLVRVLVPAPLVFPLRMEAGRTVDSMSFKGLDLTQTTEIPLLPHPGAFGVERRHHRHEGVDLYAAERMCVRAMEAGTVVAIMPFTGPEAGSPWWHTTGCVMVEGGSGVINYGEVRPGHTLAVGGRVDAGALLGQVATVLREDKGRPRSKLHLERYCHGTRSPIPIWPLGKPRPDTLLDPTGLLLRAAGSMR